MYGFESLIGLKMWGPSRALDLQGFQFGDSREVPVTRGRNKGSTKTVGQFALHLQCFWKVTRSGRVLVGSADEGDSAGRILWDLLEGADHRVAAATSDAAGCIRIHLSDDLVLEARPLERVAEEAWRLFRPSSEEPHLVYPGGASSNG
jgi:hypothetical protein